MASHFNAVDCKLNRTDGESYSLYDVFIFEHFIHNRKGMYPLPYLINGFYEVSHAITLAEEIVIV